MLFRLNNKNNKDLLNVSAALLHVQIQCGCMTDLENSSQQYRTHGGALQLAVQKVQSYIWFRLDTGVRSDKRTIINHNILVVTINALVVVPLSFVWSRWLMKFSTDLCLSYSVYGLSVIDATCTYCMGISIPKVLRSSQSLML